MNQTAQNSGEGGPHTDVQPSAHPIRRRIWRLVALIIISAAVLAGTSPRSVPSLLLIVGFAALAGILYGIVRLVLIVSGLDDRLAVRTRRAVILSTVLLPILLLIMQSIGQLTLRDVLTLCGLFALGVFYVNRVRQTQ